MKQNRGGQQDARAVAAPCNRARHAPRSPRAQGVPKARRAAPPAHLYWFSAGARYGRLPASHSRLGATACARAAASTRGEPRLAGGRLHARGRPRCAVARKARRPRAAGAQHAARTAIARAAIAPHPGSARRGRPRARGCGLLRLTVTDRFAARPSRACSSGCRATGWRRGSRRRCPYGGLKQNESIAPCRMPPVCGRSGPAAGRGLFCGARRRVRVPRVLKGPVRESNAPSADGQHGGRARAAPAGHSSLSICARDEKALSVGARRRRRPVLPRPALPPRRLRERPPRR